MIEEKISIGNFWLNDIRVAQHEEGWCYGISFDYKTGGHFFSPSYFPPHTPLFSTKEEAIVAGLKYYLDEVQRQIEWSTRNNCRTEVQYMHRLQKEARSILFRYEESYQCKNGDVWIQLDLFK